MSKNHIVIWTHISPEPNGERIVKNICGAKAIKLDFGFTKNDVEICTKLMETLDENKKGGGRKTV